MSYTSCDNRCSPHNWALCAYDVIIDHMTYETLFSDVICISIYEIYIALLHGNYSEALPAQARAKISFKELVKGAGQIPWKRAEFR